MIYSAEEEVYGKPHPGVYLSTAHKLGCLPHQCVALEDSLNGVIAAKAALMKCIAIPEDFPSYSRKFPHTAQHMKRGLEKFRDTPVA